MRYLRGKYRPYKKLGAKTVIFRVFLSLITLIAALIIALYSSLFILVNGECEPLRERLVLSAMQASATKWLPSLFMPQSEVDKIVEKSYEVTTDTISLDEYLSSDKGEAIESSVSFEDAVDGMILEEVRGTTFTGYVLIIPDPSRVYVGTSSDFKNNEIGMKIFDMAKKEDAVALINGGEFSDPGGQGDGNNPMGITYSKGECVWEDKLRRTFIGFDKNDKLVVTESMTREEADALGIRDGVSFQNGNTLITSDGGEVVFHYSDYNTGTAQRTAIGQRADGTVILLVTDGRSASSLGATKNDVIDVMVKYGAVTAGMLDGGSSSLMYYEDYYKKYGYDENKLDQYQKKGLVNTYKAFTPPRHLPTYICVEKEGE